VNGARTSEGVRQCRRYRACADAVPLDLALERPAVLCQCALPEFTQVMPVEVADRDSAEREESSFGELAGLVQEEQVHGHRLSVALASVKRKSLTRIV
jgi:hypothetical protein